MPKNSTGLIEIVADVNARAAYEFSEQDTAAHLSHIPLGGTVLTLPSSPSDGDRYELSDLDGSCSNTNPITLEDADGNQIAGGATVVFQDAFSWAIVRFDAKSRVWSLLSSKVGAGAGGHFWPFDATIPKTAAAPVLSQAAQTDATPPPNITAHASDAFAGAGNPGAAWRFFNGKSSDDGQPPPQWQVLQPWSGGNANMINAFFNPNTAVQSVGLGDPTIGLAGTQLVLQGASNSVVCHGTAPGIGVIGLFSLDNPNAGQCSWQIHDQDGTGSLPGAFTGLYDTFTAANESDVGIYLQRNVHTVGTGAHRYVDIQTATPPAAAVRRWSVLEGASGEANVAWYDTNGTTTATGDAFLRIPWKNSSTIQKILQQRDSADTQDFDIIQRAFGTIFFGNQGEGAIRYEVGVQEIHENNDATPGTGGWFYSNTAQGLTFHAEAFEHTIYAGGGNNGHDGNLLSASAQFNGSNLVAQTIATIALVDNAVTLLEVTVNASDTVTTTDFMVARITNSYAKNGGVITPPNNPGPGPVTLGDTTAAHGSVATLALVVSGGNILVQINTWGANTIHFHTTWAGSVNTRTS